MSNTAMDAAYTELRMAEPDYDLIDAWGIDDTLDCIGLSQIVRYLRERGYVVMQPRPRTAQSSQRPPLNTERTAQ